MSLNIELHEKAIKFAESICGPNCGICKLALEESLQLRASLYCASLKRRREESDDEEIYYDCMEFNPDIIPDDYFKTPTEEASYCTTPEAKKRNTKKTASTTKTATTKKPGTNKALITQLVEPPAKRKKDNGLGLTQKDAQDLINAILKSAERFLQWRKETNYAKDPNRERNIKYEVPDYCRNPDWSTLNSVHYLESIKYLKRPRTGESAAAESAAAESAATEPAATGQVAPEKVATEVGTVTAEATEDGLANSQQDIVSQTGVCQLPTLEEGARQDPGRQQELDQSFQGQPKDKDVKEPSAIFGSLDAISDLLQKPQEQGQAGAKLVEVPKVDCVTKETQRTEADSGENKRKRESLFETTSTENEQTPGKARGQIATLGPRNDNPFAVLSRISASIPQGNPLFAPKQESTDVFKPQTDGANFVFGQSSPAAAQGTQAAPSSIVFGSAQPNQPSPFQQTPQMPPFQAQQPSQFQQAPQVPLFQPQQAQPPSSQFVIPGFGQAPVHQAPQSNPFAGQFFSSRRGRGRGRGR